VLFVGVCQSATAERARADITGSPRRTMPPLSMRPHHHEDVLRARDLFRAACGLVYEIE
jgi:hypothetical protein